MSPSPLRLRLVPDPVLAQVAAPVTGFDADLAELAAAMAPVMYAAGGVGLAAPQVGVPCRLFVFDASGDGNWAAVVNPIVVYRAGVDVAVEGCLSVPGERVELPAPTRLVVDAQDLAGRAVRWAVAGLEARIFRHEIDHLGGRLVTDRAGRARRLGPGLQLP